MSTKLFLNSPEFSVCMACYNGASFIEEQIISIINQMSDTDELIISDNGSFDGTLDIIKKINDDRIRIFYCSRVGVTPNFENALLHSRGKFIILCDQDDVWLDGRLDFSRKQLAKYDLSVVGMQMVDEHLNLMSPPYGQRIPCSSILRTFLFNGYSGCCMAFRRELLSLILPFPPRLPMHDWWIALISMLFGKRVHITSKKLILYRRHKFNASDTGNFSNNNYCIKFKIRVNIAFNLLLRWFVVRMH
jgi:glycosyltransferase involved in cell wall biosynthesis